MVTYDVVMMTISCILIIYSVYIIFKVLIYKDNDVIREGGKYIFNKLYIYY